MSLHGPASCPLPEAVSTPKHSSKTTSLSLSSATSCPPVEAISTPVTTNQSSETTSKSLHIAANCPPPEASSTPITTSSRTTTVSLHSAASSPQPQVVRVPVTTEQSGETTSTSVHGVTSCLPVEAVRTTVTTKHNSGTMSESLHSAGSCPPPEAISTPVMTKHNSETSSVSLHGPASCPLPVTEHSSETRSVSAVPHTCHHLTRQSGSQRKESLNSPPSEVLKSERKTIQLSQNMVDSPQVSLVSSLPTDIRSSQKAASGGAEPRQNSITIKVYRRALSPILITNKNTGMSGRQESPKISNGSACLSLVKPSVQAQECSSEDLTVTVPPIRSEVVLNVTDSQTTDCSRVRGPVCPRPQLGPMQSGPSTKRPAAGQHSHALPTASETGEQLTSVKLVKPHVAHFNLPKVRPYTFRSLFPPFPSTSTLVTSLQSPASNSQASSNCQTKTTSRPDAVASPVDHQCTPGTDGAKNAAQTQQRPGTNNEGVNGCIVDPVTTNAGLTKPSFFTKRSNTGTVCPSATPPCCTSPSTPVHPVSTVSNLPPRPPSLKKPNLGPLQASNSTTSLGSPTGSSPLSHTSPPRRPLSASPGIPLSVVNPPSTKTPPGGASAGTPITSPGRQLAPLQTSLFQLSGRRPSISSQDSVSSCLTPTKSTPPTNLALGRFPCLQCPSAYPQHGVSPVTSPYHDSPSNSRPPSWYGYRMLRARDSSPSATSRDSLDSFIRSPPSGIFCTRSSVDNLIASRDSMDNISDTSGDSVFDDILSESEKKSLDDTAESVGSVGSLMDQPEACSPGGATLTQPDGAASQPKTPSDGRSSKRESANMSLAGDLAPSNHSDAEGPLGPAAPPLLVGPTSPGSTNQGQGPLPSMGPEPPPSYEEAIGLVPEGASSCHLLTYKDFVPAYNAQRRTWEPFNKVVLQANEWLVLNPEVRISSCESVLGFAAQSHGFNPDRAIGTRSQVSHENTYNLRFLRIWYSRLDQTSSDIEPQQIRYANFVSPAENASISTLVELINTKLNTAIKGDILNVETIYILRKAIQCPDTPCWIERPHDPKAYSFFLRMFWLEPQEERQEPIKLGYMDFVPQHAAGKNYPNDYEPFSVLVQVAQWWASHKAEPGANIINCQSLYVKRKALSTYWQRLHYTESAGGNNFLKNTYYNQILRFYFQTPTSCLGVPVSPTLQISCRTFTPVQLTSPTDPCLRFESFGETVNRVLHWLRLSGAQLMSIETIKIRMYGGLQGPHGAESTLMRSEGRRYADQEHWIHCIRVYLVGEYQEPDSSRIPPIPHVVPYFTTSPRPIALQPPTVAFL